MGDYALVRQLIVAEVRRVGYKAGKTMIAVAQDALDDLVPANDESPLGPTLQKELEALVREALAA